MANETFQIEIDGKQVEAIAGEMLIATADRAGIYIPRFCYHKKLKIAANCRMCLVEVANAPKTLPACATPVAPGMQAFTRSKKTIESQQAVMEFLLVNHPLDCPICDQGGECELQDLAMGYGTDKSRFTQEKRAVSDEDLGPLVSTEMTRCIHCTRCVRFCEEIAGTQQLGAFGRGGDMNIGTYLVNGLSSELSGNVVDLCPVGALTSKPFKYTGRSWEFEQHLSVSPHDCIGSNMYYHSFADNYGDDSKVMRVLPRDNEKINENWLSDRDRFSYTAFSSSERATEPMLKRDGKWINISWESALNYLTDNIKSVIKSDKVDQIGGLISPSSSSEEHYLFQKMLRAIGTNNIDHRTSTNCFLDQDNFSCYPGISEELDNISKKKSIVIVGSFTREEQPILFHKIRQAVANGARLFVINTYDYDFACDISGKKIVSSNDVLASIVAIYKNIDTKAKIENIPTKFTKDKDLKEIAAILKKDKADVAIFAGEHIESHVDAINIRVWLFKLSEKLGCSLNHLTRGANSAGAWISGAIPHRSELMIPSDKGLNAQEMLAAKLAVYFVHGLDFDHDFADPILAKKAFSESDITVALTAFKSEKMLEYADMILPIAAFSEFSGSFVNAFGDLQRFNAAVLPPAEAKPGWKVLKVIMNMLNLSDDHFSHASDITNILSESLKGINNKAIWQDVDFSYETTDSLMRIGHWPAYSCDSITRRASPLQSVNADRYDYARLNSSLAEKLNVSSGGDVRLSQSGHEDNFVCIIDDSVADNSIWLTTANEKRSNLGNVAGVIDFIKVVD
jgi:NADH-quinone oxidoreductase subunit G